MGYRALNRRSRQVLAGIWPAGAACLLASLVWPLLHGHPLSFGLSVLVLIVFTTLADLFPVTFEQGYQVTVSNVFLIGAILIFKDDTPSATMVALISTLVWQLIERKPWYKLATNVALAVTAVVAGSTIFNAIGSADVLHEVLAAGLLLVVYFIADTVPLTLLLSALDGRPFQVAYVSNYRGVVVELVAIEFFGIIFAVVWNVSPWLSLLFVVPTVILRQAYFQVERLHSESVRALGAISDIIENRDEQTHQHTETVSNYARRLAEKMALNPDQIWEVSVAGRMHDLGKISVRDSVLLKPGKLTTEEMTLMKEHCRVGHDVLQQFSNLRGVAALVRSHHERYDGGGYPDGLSGDRLPIGAAIIAVTDAFDAMTSDRPYRKAMPAERAIEVIKQGLGTQWHPVVAATFIQMILEDRLARQSDDVNTIRIRPDVAS